MGEVTKLGNGHDAAVGGGFMRRIENIRDETASKKGEHMAWCKKQKEAENEILSEAKAAGVPVKGLKALLKDRELERKQEAVIDGLDLDDLSYFESLHEKLGGLADLPLGTAAIAANEKKKPAATAEARPKKKKAAAPGDAANTAKLN